MPRPSPLLIPLLRRSALLSSALVVLLPAVGAARPPPEGTCPAISGLPGARPNEDAALTRLREGLVLSYSDALRLKELVPMEIWRNREAFFYEGMQMEIGPCHRVYSFPAFFEEANERFGGTAR